jgi:hypothetical protein
MREKYILFARVTIASIIITSLMSYTVTTVSSHIQAQAQTFDPRYKTATVSGKLGAGSRMANYNYDIPASVGNNTTTPELLQYAYNQGLIMGRQAGPVE